MCPWPIRHTALPSACWNSGNCTNTVRTGGEHTRARTGHIPSTHYRVTAALNLLVLCAAIWPQRTLQSSLNATNLQKTTCSVVTSPSIHITGDVNPPHCVCRPQPLAAPSTESSQVSSLRSCKQLCNKVSPWSTYLPKHSTSKPRRQEWGHEASSTLRTRKHWAPPHKIKYPGQLGAAPLV
jgi:hypothetical protein